MTRLKLLPLLLCLMASPALAQVFPVPMQGSNAAEGSHAFKGSMITSITVSWNAATTARYLMLFDATAVPSNGSTTACSTTQATGCLMWCQYINASTTAPNSFSGGVDPYPIPARNGVVAAMSTGAGCGTLTVDGSNDFFYAQVR